MILAAQHPVMLLDGGEQSVFDPRELRDELARCFLGAGLEESCYLASDIALAVEYALEHADRPGGVFSRAELDDMVVRILENTGYGEVSTLYRRGAPDTRRTVCAADPASVGLVLKRYFAGSSARLGRLAEQVAAALTSLHAREASPELMVELARHFDAGTPEAPVPVPAPAPTVRRADDHFILTPQEVRTGFPDGVAGLGADVCRLHGVGRLFPSIRIAFFLTRFARSRGWEPPVLEMMIQPELCAAGRALEQGRRRVLGMYREVVGKPDAELPFYLSFPDMDDFIAGYLQSSPEGTAGLRRTVADMVAAGLSGPVEKIRWNL